MFIWWFMWVVKGRFIVRDGYKFKMKIVGNVFVDGGKSEVVFYVEMLVVFNFYIFCGKKKMEFLEDILSLGFYWVISILKVCGK